MSMSKRDSIDCQTALIQLLSYEWLPEKESIGFTLYDYCCQSLPRGDLLYSM